MGVLTNRIKELEEQTRALEEEFRAAEKAREKEYQAHEDEITGLGERYEAAEAKWEEERAFLFDSIGNLARVLDRYMGLHVDHLDTRDVPGNEKWAEVYRAAEEILGECHLVQQNR